MSVLIEQFGQPMVFSSEPWVILSDMERSIKDKIEKYGTPLKDWDISIYRGVLTGCNEAFIIDENKKEELIRKDPKSAEIIRPILRGKDIKRYGYEFANLYLIATHNGYGDTPRVNIENYPAVKEWLDKGGIAYNGKPYKGYETIAARADQGDTPYNLRSCAYMDDFNKPKIVYGQFRRGSFAFDEKKCCLSSNEYFIYINDVTKLKLLLGILNSKICYYFGCISMNSLGGNTTIAQKDIFMKFPVVNTTESEQQHIVQFVDSILHADIKHQVTYETELDRYIYQLYNLTDEEIDFINKQTNQ